MTTNKNNHLPRELSQLIMKKRRKLMRDNRESLQAKRNEYETIIGSKNLPTYHHLLQTSMDPTVSKTDRNAAKRMLERRQQALDKMNDIIAQINKNGGRKSTTKRKANNNNNKFWK